MRVLFIEPETTASPMKYIAKGKSIRSIPIKRSQPITKGGNIKTNNKKKMHTKANGMRKNPIIDASIIDEIIIMLSGALKEGRGLVDFALKYKMKNPTAIKAEGISGAGIPVSIHGSARVNKTDIDEEIAMARVKGPAKNLRSNCVVWGF